MAVTADSFAALLSTDIFGASWQGRRVAVVGLGRSGLAAARLLCRLGCRVRATDARNSGDLQALERSLQAEGVEVVELGGHTTRALEDAELLVVSPGVDESSGPVQWALERQVPLMSEIELAFHFCPVPIIAVTGTNGKSTSVSLIAEILRTSGRPAVACGNLGIPFSSVLDELSPGSVAVVEVSSFQLLWCHQFRPKIAVLLNIGTNHMDRHQQHSAYLAAKARLFQRQTPEDWAVLNGRDAHVTHLAESLQAKRVWFGENRSNANALLLAEETRRTLTDSAQAVLQVARLLRIPDPLAWQVIRSFRGLEHRMEPIATVDGVRYVNDSKSTTPDSLLFALRQTRGPVVVILGGRGKGLAFRPLIDPLHESRVKGLVLIGEARARIRPLLNGSTLVREATTLESAIRTAAQLAEPGTTILFSPACASFDMFRDFEDRGTAFKAIVRRFAGAESA